MTVSTGTTILPAYFVKGEDAVVVNDAVRTLVDELVGDADAALTVEDFSSDDYELAAVVDAAQTPPFFTDRRVVVARGIGRFGVEELAVLLGYLDDPLPSTALVLVASGGIVSQKVPNALRQTDNQPTRCRFRRSRAVGLEERSHVRFGVAPARLCLAGGQRRARSGPRSERALPSWLRLRPFPSTLAIRLTMRFGARARNTSNRSS